MMRRFGWMALVGGAALGLVLATAAWNPAARVAARLRRRVRVPDLQFRRLQAAERGHFVRHRARGPAALLALAAIRQGNDLTATTAGAGA